MNATTEQIERTQREYSQIAKEPVEIRILGTAIYAFGSELACLRISNHMRNVNDRVAYSENLGTWYYSHEFNI